MSLINFTTKNNFWISNGYLLHPSNMDTTYGWINRRWIDMNMEIDAYKLNGYECEYASTRFIVIPNQTQNFPIYILSEQLPLPWILIVSFFGGEILIVSCRLVY